MAEQQQQIEYVSVKAEDVLADHRAMYDGFTRSIPYAIGVVAAVLAFLWLFWG